MKTPRWTWPTRVMITLTLCHKNSIGTLQVNSAAPTRPLRPLWLVVPPALLCMLDFGLTLYGQSESYWSGNYADVNEISPSFAQYLAIHPFAFVGAGFLWIIIFSIIVA